MRRLAQLPLTRREQAYAFASLALCLTFLIAHLVSQRIEQDQRRVGWDTLSAGTSAVSGAGPEAQVPGVRSGQPGAAPQAPRDSDTTPAALPTWVQAIRLTNLASAPNGERVMTIPQWQFLRVRGAEQGWLQVEVRDGGAAGTTGWIDLADIGISGPPPEWVRTTRDVHLYGSADGEDSVAVLTPGVDLMVSNESAGQRMFVYHHQSPTSRRSGFGWISIDSVVAIPAPAGVSLPSPSYHAVPLAGPGAYRVRPGDSQVSIASVLGMARDDLVRLNGLAESTTLQVGQVLRVPRLSAAATIEAPGPRLTRATSPGWISAENAVVIDGDSGQILWAREANTQVAPASLTKIVTALVTLDHANLSDRAAIRVDSRRMPGSTVMGIYPGEDLTVEDLLYGLMLPSGNDAALALAEHVAGTRERFSELMNDKVRSLGLSGSQFVNPHGLDATGHYSSAYDMAMLARDGMRNPVFRDLSSARSYATPNGKGYEVGNLNQLLWRYPGADGVKIGFTNAARRTIVGSAVKDGHRVYVAMMRSNDIYADTIALLDWVFDAYTWP